MSIEKIELIGKSGEIVHFSATDARTYTPNDSTVFDKPIKSFHVNADGNIYVQYPSGSKVIYTVNSGTVYSYEVIRIFATNTTVGDVIIHV